MRPLLHFTPDRGWMNDPNGLVERDGVHHLFFQHHPGAATFGLMRWGHAVSRDLLTWTELESALVPGVADPSGDPDADPAGQVAAYDQEGVWSGCAVDVDGDLWFLYTGIAAGAVPSACLARADGTDLLRLRRYPGNPVIAAPPGERTVTAFRDHVVRRDGDVWRQVIGAGTVEGRGTVFAYSSKDFLTWDYDGPMLEAQPWGLPGDVWECPDLLVQGTRVVLVVSCIGDPVCGIVQPVLWIGGTLDPAGGQRIVPDSFGLFDLGPRFYAPQSYVTSDARRVMFGWLREHFEDVAPGAAPGQVPDGDVARGRERVGIMSLPREVVVVDGRPFQKPALEVDEARSVKPVLEATVHDGTQLAVGLGECFELEIAVDGDLGAAAAVLHLAGPGSSPSEAFPDSPATFDVDLGALVREPTSWARTDDTWSPLTRSAAHARVLFDRGVVEVFLDNGSAAAWTPVHLRDVATVTFGLAAGVPAHVTVWSLAIT